MRCGNRGGAVLAGTEEAKEWGWNRWCTGNWKATPGIPSASVQLQEEKSEAYAGFPRSKA